MSGNLPNYFSPPYQYDDDSVCPECCDEFFCSRHDEDGPHEQGGEPRGDAVKYLSVCSGIEAATVAWHSLGWQAVAFSEIEPFPSAVLAHHYPDVPNLGDMTTIDYDELGAIDLLVGGTPCQSFSVAGLRKGMADDRGNLALEFVRIAMATRPRWIVWENVPGVLSSNGGEDFGSFLGALGEIGYGFAHRILDAQYFGLAQRRKRVFVVGYLGDWRPPAAVLFERKSLCGDSAPSREKGEGAAGGVAGGVGAIGWSEELTAHHDLVGTIQRGGEGGRHEGVMDPATANDQTVFVAETPIVSIKTANTMSNGSNISEDGVAYTLDQAQGQAIQFASSVRRLTPVECERLQGFPDNYTDIPWRGKPHAPDGSRYKALGNSMAVPVMRWIGERIQMVDDLLNGAFTAYADQTAEAPDA